jgi:hypothetical protein
MPREGSRLAQGSAGTRGSRSLPPIWPLTRSYPLAPWCVSGTLAKLNHKGRGAKCLGFQPALPLTSPGVSGTSDIPCPNIPAFVHLGHGVLQGPSPAGVGQQRPPVSSSVPDTAKHLTATAPRCVVAFCQFSVIIRSLCRMQSCMPAPAYPISEQAWDVQHPHTEG